METRRALDQIAEIHQHVTRADVYQDYRALPVGLSGLGAVAAAALQPAVLGPEPGVSFLWYWMAVAAFCGAIAATGVLRGYVRARTAAERHHTRTVTGQLLPAVVAGIAVSLALGLAGPELRALLPGLWAICFSLGLFASRPYLPRNIGWVGLYYLVAGVVALAMAAASGDATPWSVGIPFGVGQVFAGIVLYWNQERRTHEEV